MIKDALLALNEKGGSSSYAIGKYIEEKQKSLLPANFPKLLGQQLKNSSAKGKLIKVKASYKLADTVKKAVSAMKIGEHAKNNEDAASPAKKKYEKAKHTVKAGTVKDGSRSIKPAAKGKKAPTSKNLSSSVYDQICQKCFSSSVYDDQGRSISIERERRLESLLPANFRKILGQQLKNSAANGELIKVKASYKLADTVKKAVSAMKIGEHAKNNEDAARPDSEGWYCERWYEL
ncbi:uncharacterized protein LOC141701508 [Apium graveolens]|uniref:uncharacterized protein LOC141701508 n=1 Tax=Apium graveolens TaxID=4045 RepID=UPI003D79BFE9